MTDKDFGHPGPIPISLLAIAAADMIVYELASLHAYAVVRRRPAPPLHLCPSCCRIGRTMLRSHAEGSVSCHHHCSPLSLNPSRSALRSRYPPYPATATGRTASAQHRGLNSKCLVTILQTVEGPRLIPSRVSIYIPACACAVTCGRRLNAGKAGRHTVARTRAGARCGGKVLGQGGGAG